MSVTHIELRKKLYYQQNPKYEDIEEYLEVAKIGSHISFYALGKKPNEDTVIRLYNNNIIFKDWCDKYRDNTISFITEHQLIDFANIFINIQDNIPVNLLEILLKTGQLLDIDIMQKYNNVLRKLCLSYNNYITNYFKMCKTKKQEKSCADWLLKNKNLNQYIPRILDLCQFEVNKIYLQNEFVLKKITQN